MSYTVTSQYLGLLRRRACLLPTLRGWLLLFMLSFAILIIGLLPR